MPLRDHFRPPIDLVTSWEGFHGGWPMVIVQKLNSMLPKEYVASPRVHLGSNLDREIAIQSEYEVLIFDTKRGQNLVVGIEIVSPSNKDRPEHRRAFVNKCEALLHKGVCVVIIDLVTIRPANLYRQLVELMTETELTTPVPPLYAVTCRGVRNGDHWRVESWEYPMMLEEPLPTVPLWLSKTEVIPLELESSYEETCKALRIP